MNRLLLLLALLSTSAASAAEPDLAGRLKKLYGGDPVSDEESFQIINKGLKSPSALLISKEIDEYKVPNPKLAPKPPSSSWEKDLKGYPGLSEKVKEILNDKKLGKWKATGLDELWRVPGEPTTLVIVVRLSLKGETTPGLMDDSCLTLYARKAGDWQLKTLFEPWARASESSHGWLEVWDLNDVDGDGVADLVMQEHGYESHELVVLSPGKDGTFKRLYKGGGYGL